MRASELLEMIPEAGLRRRKPRWEKAALLVIDMQEYFRGLSQGIVTPLRMLIEACRRKGVPVIFTQHGHEGADVDGGMLGEWWGDLIIEGSPEWEILPELAPAAGEKVVAKKRYDAFHETDLDEHLRAAGRDDLIISGVMTNLCCETTARSAFVRDYRVFFLADGTAAVSEDHQIATLRNLGFGFAYLTTCEELAEGL